MVLVKPVQLALRGGAQSLSSGAQDQILAEGLGGELREEFHLTNRLGLLVHVPAEIVYIRGVPIFIEKYFANMIESKVVPEHVRGHSTTNRNGERDAVDDLHVLCSGGLSSRQLLVRLLDVLPRVFRFSYCFTLEHLHHIKKHQYCRHMVTYNLARVSQKVIFNK